MFNSLLWGKKLFDVQTKYNIIKKFIALASVIGIIFLIALLYIKPRIQKYFIDNYANIFLKRLTQLNREQRTKTLKKWNLTYNQIKEAAERNRS